MTRHLQAHPWHGIPPGEQAPEVVNVFIEMVPADTVKYEVDKTTGHLRVDRPQQFSSLCPAPYGFVPGTLCAERVAGLAAEHTGGVQIVGDGDPIDICVLTEHAINHGGILVRARPIGGLCLFDHGEADDKIVAVLLDDPAYGAFADITDVPKPLVDRLRHYFLTYKEIPYPEGGVEPRCSIAYMYRAATAHDVIRRAIADYADRFGARSA